MCLLLRKTGPVTPDISDRGGLIAPTAMMRLPEDKKPSARIGCRSCEQVCPQQIGFSEAMQDFCAKLKPTDRP